MRITFTNFGKSNSYRCMLTGSYADICVSSARRVCGVPRDLTSITANFTKNRPINALFGKNQENASKLFTIKPIRSSNYRPADICRLEEFSGTLDCDFERLLRKVYDQGHRYFYISWRTTGGGP